MQIAIDGPSGSGKSTIAKELSNLLKINYLDTGSMYRALAYKLKDENIKDQKKLYQILNNTSIDIIDDEIYIDGKNVEEKIRNEEIASLASKISKNQIIRDYLVKKQQQIAQVSDIIMDGRDIGTVVLPDAEYKFFLTADLETRAKRRLKQLNDKGIDIDYHSVLEDLKERDYNDINRKHSPLIKADDSIEIDCSKQTVDQTLKLILTIIGENDVI